MTKFRHSLVIAVTLITLAFSQIVTAANLTASVSRNTISLNDTIQLILRYDDSTTDSPELSALGKDFDVLSTQTATNRSIINGQYSVATQWHITLAPKKEGKLLIPSFNLGKAVSDAIIIEVTNNTSNTPSPVQFESVLSKKTSHIQEQLLLTLRLKIQSNVQLIGGNMEPLNIQNAIVVNFDESRKRINEQGIEWDIIDYQYAIFPQTSGELVIPSQLVQLEIAGNTWDSRSFFSTNRGNVQRFRTNEERVSILGAPQDPRAQPWLPAQKLEITEHWSASPEDLSVGDPITRTITLKAQGLTGAQLPELKGLAIPEINAYQDQAQIEDEKSNGVITGTRTETTAIVANKAGDYTLPEITINWWNTQTQSFETAKLASTTLKVKSKLSGMPDTQTYNSEAATLPTTNMDTQVTATKTFSNSPWLSWGLGASILLNALLSLALLLKRRNTSANTPRKNATKNTQAEQHEREAWHAVKQALKSADAAELRISLLNWARIKLSTPHLQRLEELALQLDDATAVEQIRLIDKTLFGNGNLSQFDANSLEGALKRLRTNSQRNANTPPPLYPE